MHWKEKLNSKKVTKSRKIIEKCDTLHGSVLHFIVAEVMFKEGSEKEVKSKNKNKNCAYNESPKLPTKLNLMTCKSMHGIVTCLMF